MTQQKHINVLNVTDYFINLHMILVFIHVCVLLKAGVNNSVSNQTIFIKDTYNLKCMSPLNHQ